MLSRPITAAVAVALALLVPSVAVAAPNYPEPKKPKGSTGKPRGPFKKHTVCKRASCDHRTIQKAINAAKPGDTISVAAGTYREGLKIQGNNKRYIKIIGNPGAPEKVVIDGSSLSGPRAQNGVLINGANEVTVRGIKAQNYKGNGFFVTNATGYTFDNLIAEKTGVYGIYAFNTKGGSMTDSLSYLQSDGAFYIGQTPEQVRPKRSIVRNVIGWGSVSGFTGTNMRYVTITKSKFFNNAIGIVPNALDSEKFPPAEDNVLSDNDVFWNNFDVYKAAPYKPSASDDFVYPPGVGIILLSGRDTVVQNNRVYGNYLTGFIAIQNLFLEAKEAVDLKDNAVRSNAFGNTGANRNGRDLVYTGNGTGNCFEGNSGVETTVPNDPAAFPGCPGPDNQDNQESIELMLKAAIQKQYRAEWIQHAQAPVGDIVPLVDYEAGKTYGPTTLP